MRIVINSEFCALTETLRHTVWLFKNEHLIWNIQKSIASNESSMFIKYAIVWYNNMKQKISIWLSMCFQITCKTKHERQTDSDGKTGLWSLRMQKEWILLWFYALKIHLVSLYKNCQTHKICSFSIERFDSISTWYPYKNPMILFVSHQYFLVIRIYILSLFSVSRRYH